MPQQTSQQLHTHGQKLQVTPSLKIAPGEQENINPAKCGNPHITHHPAKQRAQKKTFAIQDLLLAAKAPKEWGNHITGQLCLQQLSSHSGLACLKVTFWESQTARDSGPLGARNDYHGLPKGHVRATRRVLHFNLR